MWRRASYEMKTAVWTLVAVAIANTLALVVVVRSLRSVIFDQGEETVTRATHLAEAERLRVSLEEEMRFLRAYLYAAEPDDEHLVQAREARAATARHLAHLEDAGAEVQALMPALRAGLEAFHRAIDEAKGQRLSAQEVTALIATEVTPHFEEAQRLLGRYSLEQEQALAAANQASRIGAGGAMKTVITAAISSGLFTGSLALFLWLSLRLVRDQQQRLVRTVAELERSNADLDAFAGRVAHDLRNVLAPASLALKRINEVAPSQNPLVPYLRVIERSADRAAKLIEALLAFSRAEQAPQECTHSVARIIDDALEEVSAPASDAHVEISREVVDAAVRCGPGMLHAVLSNLLSNAVKFTVGEPRRQVAIRGRPIGDRYLIEVQDSGPGIPASQRQRIFEPFYRVEGSRAEGFGIGLATVKRIVDAQGGWIEVADAQPRGTLMRVFLPLEQTYPIEREPEAPVHH